MERGEGGYIHHADGTEELYDVRKDPHEWHNLARDKSLTDVKRKLRASAPTKFAAPGPPRNRLKLVIEGESFRWQLKPKRKKKPKRRKQPTSARSG